MTRTSGTVAVITDSTADIPAPLAAENAITVVPLSLTIGGETFVDGVLTQAEFFTRMNAAPVLPTTSQPPMGAFVRAYEAALETAESVVSVHISSLLSGTVESARQAAERFGGRVRVVDSRTLSFALGFQALAAARASAAGQDIEAVVEAVKDVRDRVELYVGLDRLDNLAKGGRIGKVAALLGGMLDLKVSLTVENGAFVPVARDRGVRSALDRTLRRTAEKMGEHRRGRFCVLHALAEDKAEYLRRALEEAYEVVEMHVFETGSVIATHTGTAWGLAFVPE